MTELKNTELFEKNLDFFKKAMPDLHQHLSEIEETSSQLIFDEDGNPDIEFRGQKLYDKPIDEFVEEQLEAYYAAPQGIHLAPPQTSNMDSIGQEFNYNVLKRSVEEVEATFSAEPENTEEAFYIVVMGIGLGKHIPEIAKRSKCCGLLMLEPNLEFIYHSLYITDWVEIFEPFKGPETGRYANIYCDNEPEYNTSLLLNFIRGINPSFCDGLQIYTHYPNTILDATKKSFVREASMAVTGLGFFDDEKIMIENTYRNFKDSTDYIFKDSGKRCDLPIFVIGSGPSLSMSFDFLRENQDKAIIVSGGTALKPLLANGIRSDFQIEIENVEAVIGVLTDIKENFGTEGTTLVTSNSIQPDAANCFDKKVFFFRNSLSTTPIFSWGTNHQLREVSPTVGNAAVSFAQQIGGREFYFFGLDYGARQAEQMHVKGSAYDDGVAFKRRFDQKYKGNFGGHVYVDHIMRWARIITERSIRRYQRGHTYYNCSDGSFIENTIPRLPRSLKPLPAVDKQKAVEQILANFGVYSPEHFKRAWFAKDWKQEASNLCNDIIKILDDELENKEERSYWARYLEKIARAIIAPEEQCSPEMLMMRGSIFMMFMTAVFYPPRVTDPDTRKKVEIIVIEELKKSIEDLRKKVETFFDELDPESEQPFEISSKSNSENG
ncbi:conserved hypothetical protein [Candidatus Terasakiella magnetica]|uniref:DUF115 domain-containing protein n=1 Tax=Candidatus Terasakiella magnetica TaxID=1867952 RepID=A0A1C3RKS7_9PROT|nr:6-hydroxymethylpterin diphosphokinase MptE-like protein [Candidatus Terasakiella magnetica]SCA57858.1 conserved hypothetical protein [Candidatus Terasakiella magnetica]